VFSQAVTHACVEQFPTHVLSVLQAASAMHACAWLLHPPCDALCPHI
jgi:hypothetical protein